MAEQEFEKDNAVVETGTTSICTIDEDSVKDPNLVDWDGDADPVNAQNWANGKKIATTVILATFSLTASLSASMIAPCLDRITADLHIRNAFVSQMTMSAYVLSWGIGPLILGPLSEVYGRAVILHISFSIYLAFNLACGFVTSTGELICFRVLAGLGAGAPFAIMEGVLGDMWPREQLGKAVALQSLVSLLGPAIGPIMGGLVNENLSWRWTFHITSIFTGVVMAGGFLTLRESYGPFLLRARARCLRRETGNESLHTNFDLEAGLLRMLTLNLLRPLRLSTTQIVIQIIALYSALIYGVTYIILTSFASIMMETYHERSAISSLHYVSLGVGLFIGAQVGARLNDKIYVRLKKGNAGVGLPEHHLPLMIPAVVLFAAGFLWFGLSIQARLFWIMPDIGIVLLHAGFIVCIICIQTFTIEAYPRYAASAMSVFSLSRSLAGFTFPLFSPYLFRDLGYRWAGLLLALTTLAVGLPVALVLWRYGHILRAKSSYARG